MRLRNLFACTLVISMLASRTQAISCELASLMSHPTVANNAEFWQDLGEIGDKLNDTDLRNLLRKHGVDSPSVERRAIERAEVDSGPAAARAAVGAPKFTLSKQAIKDSRTLRPALKKDLDLFLSYAKDGVGSLQAELRKNAGKWNYKKLTGALHDDYSVRLDGGTRVLFKQHSDGLIEILQINNSATH